MHACMHACMCVGTGFTRKHFHFEPWPLHDIAVANIVWCMAYTREVGGGIVYCPIVGQSYCTNIGNADGRGE